MKRQTRRGLLEETVGGGARSTLCAYRTCTIAVEAYMLALQRTAAHASSYHMHETWCASATATTVVCGGWRGPIRTL